MTTIVYDVERGVVVSDSKETGDMIRWCKKLFRVNDHIIATAGSSYSGLAFVQWFEQWENGDPDWDDKPDLAVLGEDEDFECIVVRPDGTFFTINKLFVPYEHGKPKAWYVVGSGGNAAMGALLAGATAEEAVRIASKVDEKTGGRLQIMKVQDNA